MKNSKIIENTMTDPFLPVDKDGYYGDFGGAYIPEILHSNVEKLNEAFSRYIDDPEFIAEYVPEGGIGRRGHLRGSCSGSHAH